MQSALVGGEGGHRHKQINIAILVYSCMIIYSTGAIIFKGKGKGLKFYGYTWVGGNF